MLLSFAYHFQIDKLSKRINQTFEIALRYFIFDNLEANQIKALSFLQMCFNNSSNIFIEKSFNEMCYEFKIKEALYIVIEINKNINKNVKTQLDNFETMRFRYRQKVVDVRLYASIVFKIKYDSMYILLLLKLEDRAFLRLYYNYALLDKHNKKLNN